MRDRDAQARARPETDRASLYRLGLLGVLLAALAASSAGLIVRQIEAADGWQILVYRALAFVVVLLTYIVIQRGRDTLRAFLAVGWLGLLVAVALGSAFIAFIFSLLLTTVAQAVFILSAAPFFAALLGLLWLRERVTLFTCLSMVVALAGIAVMMGPDLAGGGASGALLGSLSALGACFGFAVTIVALRAGRRVDMMPATCLAGVFAGLVCLVIADDLAIGPRDMVFALLLGSGQLGLQYLLITLSARHVPAAQIALLMLLEVVLAPIWVWLAIGETPSSATLLGGAIVLAAVLAQTLYELRGRKP